MIRPSSGRGEDPIMPNKANLQSLGRNRGRDAFDTAWADAERASHRQAALGAATANLAGSGGLRKKRSHSAHIFAAGLHYMMNADISSPAKSVGLK